MIHLWYVVSYPYVVKITAVSTQIGHFLSTFVLQEVEETHNLKMYMALSMNFTF
jgi:hypothetical protein